MERKNVQAAIWLIGLGILFWVGYIWPGILILIGLSMLVSVYMKEETPPVQPPAAAAPLGSSVKPAEQPEAPAAGDNLPAILAPEGERLYLASRLPEKCPACDAAMRANAESLTWHEDKSFACMFCGYRISV